MPPACVDRCDGGCSGIALAEAQRRAKTAPQASILNPDRRARMPAIRGGFAAVPTSLCLCASASETSFFSNQRCEPLPRVFRHARLHGRELRFGCRGLPRGLPFRLRHPVDKRAGGCLVSIITRISYPVGEAVAAKPRQPHQLDILRIVAMAQMAHQPAERGGGHGIVQPVERVGGGSVCIRIH